MASVNKRTWEDLTPLERHRVVWWEKSRLVEDLSRRARANSNRKPTEADRELARLGLQMVRGVFYVGEFMLPYNPMTASGARQFKEDLADKMKVKFGFEEAFLEASLRGTCSTRSRVKE